VEKMKKIILSIVVLILCVSGTALAAPVMLPADAIWFDFQNREQIDATGNILPPGGGPLESNWGIATVNAIRLGTVTESNANIEGNFVPPAIFTAGGTGQITGMFYGIQLVDFGVVGPNTLRSSGGFLDLYWDEPGLVGGGTIVNLPTLDDSLRSTVSTFPGITDGILLAHLEFASGIDPTNGNVTIVGSSAGLPTTITGIGAAESYANQLPGGYWDGLLDQDWFTTAPAASGGGPLAFGSRDVRFRNTFSSLLQWHGPAGSNILGADSSDPATTYTTCTGNRCLIN
jgi:hypothetical protein